MSYANKIVAAKSWAALFAIKDWALAVKKNKKRLNKTIPKQSLIEILKSYLDIQKEKDELKKWKTRNIESSYLNLKLPKNCERNSPEKTLILFLQYWSKNNYGKMASLIENRSNISLKNKASEIREIFQGKELNEFKISEIYDEAVSITEILVEAKINNMSEKLTVRMVYEEDNKSAIRGKTNGKWLIEESSFYSI